MAQAFFARILQWVANEVIVEKLAHSKAFQRFAVRTADTIEKAKSTTTQQLQQQLQQAPKVAQSVHQKTKATQSSVWSFAQAFKDEVAKDFTKQPPKKR